VKFLPIALAWQTFPSEKAMQELFGLTQRLDARNAQRSFSATNMGYGRY
jgi:hypothetical protein